MGINYAAFVATLIQRNPESKHDMVDHQKKVIMECILGRRMSLKQRVHELISFETMTRIQDESYIISMIEALFLAHSHEGEALLTETALALKRHKHPELWMMYPLAITGILRASNYIEKGEIAPFEKILPLFIGSLACEYIDAAHVNIKEEHQCSKSILGELNNELSGYLGPKPTKKNLDRAREILAMMDKCERKIQKPVHKFVSQFTHRAFSMIDMRTQIANLRYGFDNFDITPALPDGPTQVM